MKAGTGFGCFIMDGLIDATVVDAVNSLLDGKSENFTHGTTIHESGQDIADIVNPPD